MKTNAPVISIENVKRNSLIEGYYRYRDNQLWQARKEIEDAAKSGDQFELAIARAEQFIENAKIINKELTKIKEK